VASSRGALTRATQSKTLNMKVKDPRDLLKQQVEHAYAELAAKEAGEGGGCARRAAAAR
jgi:hypothetical protein